MLHQFMQLCFDVATVSVGRIDGQAETKGIAECQSHAKI